jgi:hypothetical protein
VRIMTGCAIVEGGVPEAEGGGGGEEDGGGGMLPVPYTVDSSFMLLLLLLILPPLALTVTLVEALSPSPLNALTAAALAAAAMNFFCSCWCCSCCKSLTGLSLICGKGLSLKGAYVFVNAAPPSLPPMSPSKASFPATHLRDSPPMAISVRESTLTPPPSTPPLPALLA